VQSERVHDEQPTDCVAVSYEPDDGYAGRLHVRVRFDGFEGRAVAWVDRVRVSMFAEELKRYPLDQSAPVTFSAGIGDADDYIEFIAISVAPIGGKGQVVLRIRLASEDWRDGKPVSVHSTSVEFPTSYEFLRRFSGHLHMVLDSHLDQASLEFDILV
jgi:hypothetical protein